MLSLLYFKTLLIMLALAVMYLVVYFYKLATGLLLYYVQILSYLIVILSTWRNVYEYVRPSRITGLISFFTISYTSVYMLMGLWVGFGLSPYSTTTLGVLVNVVHTSSRVLCLEFLRTYLIDILKYRHRLLTLYLTTIIIWLLTWFPYPLIATSLDLEGLKTAFRYLIPSFISSAFSTFLILNHGLIPSMIYNLVPQVLTKITPYLPILDWLLEGTFSALVPLLGYYLVLPYTKMKGMDIRALRIELKNAIRLIAYFALLMLSVMLLQGYFGFRLFAISSRSMEPALHFGDVVIVCTYCMDISEGDIVAYVSEFGIIVHRVVKVDREMNYTITKGDANENVDPRPVPFKNVLGKVVLSIPWIGYPSLYIRTFLASDYSLIAFATLLASIIVYSVIRHYKVYV